MTSDSSKTMPENCRIVNADQLAILLGITSRWVQKLAKEGMPKAGRGRYDVAECIQYVINEKEQKAGTELKDQRLLLYQAQTEKLNLEMEQKRRELIEAAEVEHVLNELSVTFCSQVDSIGARLAQELVGWTDPAEIKERIDDESRQVRESVLSIVKGWQVMQDNTGDN
jgi:phage terminase Nu1 subunit (DNA packaging protein)